MLFAVLEFADFVIIAAIVAIISGGAAASASYFRPVDRNRLQRVEHKLDLIMTHLGLDYTPPARTVWQEMANDPAQKISAIKAYREQYGVGLAEAKKAVEDYIEGKK